MFPTSCERWFQEQRRRRKGITDPTFGRRVVYDSERLVQSWENFLDSLGFPKASPIRQHVRQLFSREDLDEQFQGLYDALCNGSVFGKGHFERFSRGIRGHVHVLLDKKTKISLLPPTSEDLRWISQGFEGAFEERPLDRQSFPSIAKLVLLRRVVRTLIEYVGIEQLKAGVAAPLVVDLAVEIAGRAPFRLHTVAPCSAPSLKSGERLDLIAE
ncbi:unnamed protein product [Effrenium voratum]|nr:unnamed protein product [Effrenium voratum]CAJ1437632.1 unnamed protein product [Effrenium voratum]